MRRRRFLTGLGVGASSGLAGCGGVVGEFGGGDDGSVAYELQSDRIYRSRPVRTDPGLVLSFTYAVGDTAYRFRDADGEETMLFPRNGWFLKTTVNWIWEEDIPADWSFDPASFQIVTDGQHFDPVTSLPHDLDWSAIEGRPVKIVPHFAAGPVPAWESRQGLVNYLFDTPADSSVPYYLRWTPTAPVAGSTEPVYLTSTYGPFERGESTDDG